MSGVAVVGLGNLGLAFARRLAGLGLGPVAIDLSAERRALYEKATGLEAASGVAAVEQGRVFVVVRTTEQAAAVLAELRERAATAPLPAFVVTTLAPPFARGLGAEGSPGMRVVELPVSGGEARVLDGTLTAMLAGPATDDDVRFLEERLVTNLVRFPEYGQPTVAKLLNNVLSAYNAKALAEMLAFGREHGLDPARLYDVIETASGGSFVASIFPVLIDDLLVKDVGLAEEHLSALPAVDLDGGRELDTALAAARALITR